MAIQIGKYKRPGIFVEEIDKSIFTTPVVDGINNLVIGVSKKGPVNTPVRITTQNDLEAIFGQLDRNLERKGSYFHRTISKVLEIAPVYAVNLLITDDTLDQIEYKSISTSAANKNDILRKGPYRRFFDTTGFWKRDTDSFINLTKNNTGYSDRAISFTNLSDRNITAFIVKSSLTGFDRTLLEWYGSIEKMPAYLNQTDYASDYLVDVVVVSGDWSNYQDLSVDSRWSKYFNASGLRKDQLRNFANDRNITLLNYYEGLSLIPYFKDLSGRNIFIETNINRDTDKTGLFCAFNNDLVESDFYNGKMDLIGNTIADKEETDIEFLSYKDVITESVLIKSRALDLPGNVTQLGYNILSASPSTPNLNGPYLDTTRSAYFNEGYVNDVVSSYTYSVGTSSVTVNYAIGTASYAIISDTYLALGSTISTTASFTIDASTYVQGSGVTVTGSTYSHAFVINSNGEFKMKGNDITNTDLVLGYIELGYSATQSQFTSTPTFTNVTVDSLGYKNITDYTIGLTGSNGSGKIKVEFTGTDATPSATNYSQWRKIRLFNRMVDLIDSPNKDKMVMLVGTDKYSFENITITDIITDTTKNKSFILNTTLTDLQIASLQTNGLVLYTVDDELILGTNGVETKNTEATATIGVVGKYSKLYTSFFDGLINTKDFLYGDVLNNTQTANITFAPGETATNNITYAGYDYIISDVDLNLAYADKIKISDSVLNKGFLTIVGDSATNLSSNALAGVLGYTGSYAYEIVENTEYEVLTNVNSIYNYNKKHYLKMYLDNNNAMKLEFLDSLLESIEAIDVNKDESFYIQSNKSNYKQSIEIESPSNYVQVPNKVLINGSRYSEVKVGDFLESYVDVNSLEPGQVGKKLTRILSKRQYSGDTSLTEITCDARIATYFEVDKLQTMRYVTIDQYVSTYKALTFKGFRIRQASMPDGTEAKQNQILNIVAKGTPMYNAMINKEAIDFRYLVDSFGLGLTERSKQQLVDICGGRLDILGFINMPSVKSFKNSTSPSFVNSEGTLQVEYIAKGGDPESNPAFLYSFAEGEGASCVGYFTPYVTVNDNGRPLEFPPASYVATTYIRKHISNISSITPWTIAAGVTNGRVTAISGLEIDYTPSDIEFLNQAQMNPLVFKRNRGYIIETENTAVTLYKSSLSYIHSREVLIEIEKELSRMLLDYQWKFNTPDVRAEIKLRADVICETYVSKNGIYNYFNKMDDENNTSDVIDNQMGVLDTYIEIIKGMGIIVNNITILRTGAISAGGFINS